MRAEDSFPASSAAVNTVLLYPELTTSLIVQEPSSAMVAWYGPDVTNAPASLVPANSTTLLVTVSPSTGAVMAMSGAVVSAAFVVAGALVAAGAWVVVAAATVSVGSSAAASMGSVGKDCRAPDPAVDTETARTADATLPEMTPS